MTMTPEPDGLPPSLRFLRMLVIILMLTMIAGVITVVVLLVTRLPGSAPAVPPDLALPEGARPAAVTMGQGWVAVVTTDDRILIFGADGRLWQSVAVTRPGN